MSVSLFLLFAGILKMVANTQVNKFACPANEQEKHTEIIGLIVKTISKKNINKQIVLESC